MTRQLYTQVIPGGSVSGSESAQQRSVSSQKAVSGGQPSVRSTGTAPNVRRLEGSFRGRDSELMAVELEELFSASNIEEVPYFSRGGPPTPSLNGYYALNQVGRKPGDPRRRNVHQFDGEITKIGTQKSHWRAVDIIQQSVASANPFSDGSELLVGVPSTASKLFWYDSTTGYREPASVQTTRNHEFGDIDLTDPATVGQADPANNLLYELSYEEEGKSDVRLWDTLDRPKSGAVVSSSTQVGSATVGAVEADVRWQKVFLTDHRFEGYSAFENGLFRLVLDDEAGRLEGYEWNDTTGDFVRVPTGNDLETFEVDVTHIGTARIEAQVVLEDTSQGSGNPLYPLELILARGAERPLWLETDNGRGPNSTVINELDPIASGADTFWQPRKTLVTKEEVRR